jgi:hypothetical protein
LKTVQAILPAILIFLSLVVTINPVSSGATVVKVDPPLVEYSTNATGQQFTVTIKIVDVTNLYGFDIKFRWNTTFLDYVSHSIRVPRDTYPDGVLWNPIIPITDEVNTTAGTYWIAYTSRWPAPSFNGTGAVFTITFRVKYHPVQYTANIELELYSTDLAASDASSIPHTTQHGTVILHALTAGHDVAVVDIQRWKTVVGQGYSMRINVTVSNQGDFTETFNVTVYANTTAIETQTVNSMPNGTSTILTFTWGTTGFAKGNYTIWAYAVPVQDETDTADNTYEDGWVLVSCVGDVNGDKKTTIADIVLVIGKFGTTPSSLGWNPNMDIDDNDKVTIGDIVITINNFGNIWT